MHMFGFDGYGMGGGGGMLMMILFWIVIIIAVYYIFKILTEKNGTKSFSPESAEEILKKRYARGEISLEEFEKIKKDIK